MWNAVWFDRRDLVWHAKRQNLRSCLLKIKYQTHRESQIESLAFILKFTLNIKHFISIWCLLVESPESNESAESNESPGHCYPWVQIECIWSTNVMFWMFERNYNEWFNQSKSINQAINQWSGVRSHPLIDCLVDWFWLVESLIVSFKR